MPDLWPGDVVAWRNRALLLFDRVPVPIALCDNCGGIVMANLAMAAEWGELPGRLSGQSALTLFRPWTRNQLDLVVEAIRLGHRSRYPITVSWSAAASVERYGELMIDLVGDAPDAQPVLLLYLRVLGEVGDGLGNEARATTSDIETRVLALVARGSTTAQIAKMVGLTVDGVNYHLGRLSRRWGVSNRAALVARAYVTGVLAPREWPPLAAAQ